VDIQTNQPRQPPYCSRRQQKSLRTACQIPVPVKAIIAQPWRKNSLSVTQVHCHLQHFPINPGVFIINWQNTAHKIIWWKIKMKNINKL